MVTLKPWETNGRTIVVFVESQVVDLSSSRYRYQFVEGVGGRHGKISLIRANI